MQLRECARVREIEVVVEFVDYATGTTEDRSHYRRLFETVRKVRVNVVSSGVTTDLPFLPRAKGAIAASAAYFARWGSSNIRRNMASPIADYRPLNLSSFSIVKGWLAMSIVFIGFFFVLKNLRLLNLDNLPYRHWLVNFRKSE